MKRFVLFLTLLLLGNVWNIAHAALPDIQGFVELDYGVKVSDDNTKRDNFNRVIDKTNKRKNKIARLLNIIGEKYH